MKIYTSVAKAHKAILHGTAGALLLMGVFLLPLQAHAQFEVTLDEPEIVAATPVAESFTATPTSIVAGNSSTLSWTSANATSCSSAVFATGLATSGSVSVSPGSTSTYSISCTGDGGTSAVSYVTVTVTAPVTVNLTAAITTPTSATVGTSVNLSSIITNSGNTSTGITFTDVFQTATDSSGTGATVRGTFTNPVLAAGATNVATLSYSFPTAGTTFVRACADQNAFLTGTITETNESDNCSAWTAVTVAASPIANLTAGSITPTTATAGTALILSSTITNNGSASTGTIFTDVFQSATSAAGAGATVIGTFANPILTAGVSNTATLSYTFLSTGTTYVRACADSNASLLGSINESNESDNCSAWTAVSVTAPSTGPWVSEGCGVITQTYNASCNKTAEPLDITCPAGSRLEFQDTQCPTGSNNDISKRAARCVVDAACPALIAPLAATATLSASPANVTTGRSSTLTWSSTNANSCNGTDFSTLGAISGSVSTGALTATTNYSVTCSGSGTGTGTGIWKFVESDVSDMTCPFTGDAYSYSVWTGVPTCPTSSPDGKVCSSPGTECKVNTQTTAGGCFINTSLYTCSGGTQIPPSTASATAVVTVRAVPNLTAGAITPTSATVGTAVALSAVISNIGTAATGGSFTNLFQFDADSDHSSVTSTRTNTSPTISPSGTDTSTVSNTFATTGLWYVRACADNNASFVGSVDETNEGDNCGAWTTITVAPAGVASCSVSQTSIPAYGSVTWSASPLGLGTYVWVPTEGGAPGGTSSTLSRTYSTPGTYGMSVSGGGGSANCPNVVVGASLYGVAVPSIVAKPTRVVSGNTTQLTLNATGVDLDCTITGPGVSRTIVGVNGSLPTTVITTPGITNQSTYTLTCDNVEASVKAIVNIIPAVQEF